MIKQSIQYMKKFFNILDIISRCIILIVSKIEFWGIAIILFFAILLNYLVNL